MRRKLFRAEINLSILQRHNEIIKLELDTGSTSRTRGHEAAELAAVPGGSAESGRNPVYITGGKPVSSD